MSVSAFTLPAQLDIPDDVGFTKSLLDEAFNYINQKLTALAAFQPSWTSAVNELNAIGLQRINSALQPVFDQLTRLAGLGAVFQATSTTSLPIQLGTAVFTLDPSEWSRFAASGYMMAIATDNSAVMSGTVSNYDISTGELSMIVSVIYGSGTNASWSIMPSIPSLLGAPIVDGGMYDPGAAKASSIQMKRSKTTGRVPTTLADGEMAINMLDGLMFWKDSTNGIHSVKLTSTDVDAALYAIDENLAAKANLSQVLEASNNLSDLASKSTTLANLGFTSNFTTPSGWCAIPCGSSKLYIQWGHIINGNVADFTVAFPVSFPNGILSVVASPRNASNATAFNTVTVDLPTVSNFVARPHYANNGGGVGQSSIEFYYIAIGF